MEPYGQLAILAVVVAVAVWPLACRGDRLRDYSLVAGAMLIVVVAGWSRWEPARGRAVLEAAELDGSQSSVRRRIFKERLVPRQQIGDEYVSSQTCRSCHPGRFSTWHRTFHRTMTQLASPQSVIPSHTGQFDGVVLRSRGRRYELERRGEEFWVRMVDPDWDRDRRAKGLDDTGVEPPMVARQLVMTTGSHHQQTYWIPSRWGYELLQFPWEFQIAEKMWFPTEDAELREESPERYSGHWNSSCMHCHSVAPNPGLNKSREVSGDNPELFSEVAELGISCEACHGPAARHVAKHRNPLRRLSERFRDGPDPTIINPGRLDHVRSSQVCGRCHALKVAHDKDGYLRNLDPYRPGGDLEEHYRLVDFDDPYHQQMIKTGSHLYWNDGSCRLGGREYLGQLASTCYTKGKMSCLSCHAMHESDPNDQLAEGMRGDRACLQCHSRYAGKGLEAHTHHKAGSSGSRCYNCHMP
ncbi:MAG: cytochrome c3 family protein, partial [Planctomycetaceae bacterium]